MSSVEHRSIARLPLEIFTDLQHHRTKDSHHDSSDDLDDDDVPDEQGFSLSPEELRREIAAKLKAARIRKYRGDHSTTTNIGGAHHPGRGSDYLPKSHCNSTNNKYYESSITTVGSMLRLSPIALLRALDPLLTYLECQELYRRVGRVTAPSSVTAWELLQQQQQNAQKTILSTGLYPLDAHLRGGFRTGTLTEVVGCAGAAKTQLALQMACLCPGATIFVDTESKVSLARLQEMADATAAAAAAAATTTTTDNVLSRVTVYSPTNLEELCHVLGQLEDEILNHNSSSNGVVPVQLLVIDSIAAPARRHEFGSAAAQAATVLQMAQTVKRLADQFQLVALVINQVASSSMSTSSSSAAAPSNSHTSKTPSAPQPPPPPPPTKAALGTAWHHCVSTRVQLDLITAPGGTIVARHATVVKSNLVSTSPPLEFKVTTQGLVALGH